MDLKELIDNYIIFHEEIEKIIGYKFFDGEITPMLDTKWTLDEPYFNFDRDEEGDMEEYSRFQLSSYSAQSKEFYTGEGEGFFFVMGHEEDERWDSASVFIFKMDNKI